jgi:hypothetical protein
MLPTLGIKNRQVSQMGSPYVETRWPLHVFDGRLALAFERVKTIEKNKSFSDFIDKCMPLVAKIIKNIIYHGKLPDWNRLELCGKWQENEFTELNKSING